MFKTMQSFRSGILVPLLIVIISSGLVSFADKEGRHTGTFCRSTEAAVSDGLEAGNSFVIDTLPVDGIAERLEAALGKIEQQLRKLEKQIEDVGYERAAEAYQKAVRDVDWKRLENAAGRSLAQTHAAMDRAQQKFTRDHKVQLMQLDRELAIAGKKLAQHSRELAYNIERNVQVELRKAQVELKKSNGKLKDVQNLIDDLAKDKLIDKDGKYALEIKEGELYINGKLQPQSVTEKYKKRYKAFFEPGNHFNINSNKDKKIIASQSSDEGLI